MAVCGGAASSAHAVIGWHRVTVCCCGACGHPAGTGVHVYILDTGIKATHSQFKDPVTGRPRAVHGFDAISGSNSSDDCHGHGTHVAAIVGGGARCLHPAGAQSVTAA